MQFPLTVPSNAYIFGLLQTDGHLREATRNRSQITIELKDFDIINKIHNLSPVKSTVFTRKRKTNFSNLSVTHGLRICNYRFKEEIKKYGLPAGRKSEIIAEPSTPFSKHDYYRGIIDGDGSVGMTSKDLPFISFTTASQTLAEQYLAFISGLCGQKFSANRNKRDNVFNISLFRENAQTVIRHLYYDGCLAIGRKYDNARLALQWARPVTMKKRDASTIKRWNQLQDNYILTHSIEDSCHYLRRTERSVKMRLYRLRGMRSCQ